MVSPDNKSYHTVLRMICKKEEKPKVASKPRRRIKNLKIVDPTSIPSPVPMRPQVETNANKGSFEGRNIVVQQTESPVNSNIVSFFS